MRLTIEEVKTVQLNWYSVKEEERETQRAKDKLRERERGGGGREMKREKKS
jgi:hypothetical protein